MSFNQKHWKGKSKNKKGRDKGMDWSLTRALKTNEYGTSAFHDAAQNGEFEFCEKIMCQMIENNVSDKNPISESDNETPLHNAALNGHFRICKLIMDNVENKCPIAKDGKIPLHWAARQGHAETCELILQNITKDEANIQFYKCYICKLEVSMQPCPKTAFENHFASDHVGKEPRGMTPYEYALYKSQWESAEIFRKYLEISEPAKTTKIRMMKTENQDEIEPKNEIKNGLTEEMEFQKGLNIIDQLDLPMGTGD